MYYVGHTVPVRPYFYNSKEAPVSAVGDDSDINITAQSVVLRENVRYGLSRQLDMTFHGYLSNLWDYNMHNTSSSTVSHTSKRLVSRRSKGDISIRLVNSLKSSQSPNGTITSSPKEKDKEKEKEKGTEKDKENDKYKEKDTEMDRERVMKREKVRAIEKEKDKEMNEEYNKENNIEYQNQNGRVRGFNTPPNGYNYIKSPKSFSTSPPHNNTHNKNHGQNNGQNKNRVQSFALARSPENECECESDEYGNSDRDRDGESGRGRVPVLNTSFDKTSPVLTLKNPSQLSPYSPHTPLSPHSPPNISPSQSNVTQTLLSLQQTLQHTLTQSQSQLLPLTHSHLTQQDPQQNSIKNLRKNSSGLSGGLRYPVRSDVLTPRSLSRTKMPAEEEKEKQGVVNFTVIVGKSER